MSLGKYKDKLETILSNTWDWYNDNFANGTLVIAVPSKQYNISNPTAIVSKTYTEYTFYGLLGYKTQFNQDGSPLAITQTDSKTLEIVIPYSELGLLDYTSFEALTRKPDVNIKINNEAVSIARIINDSIVKCVVITFNKDEGK